ncbi:MAG: glyoxylate reductase [Candidatus Azotimanducaceae bacterium]|jgi:glyoxylate reductase
MASVYVTRKIPEVGITMLKEAGHEVTVSEKDGVLTKEELLQAVGEKPYDAVLCLLTDPIDAAVFAAVPSAKIFANYAVGFNNINTDDAVAAGVTITNTPGVLTDTVAEYALSLIMSVTKRVAEGDRFARAGKYDGWAPELLLGSDLKGKTLGILGAGRIGTGVAVRAHKGLDMNVIYYDIKPNEFIEKDAGASFRETVDEVMKEADVVSVHVPLLESTTHLINAERLAMMKDTAYLINTSRGPVVDEKALVEALQNNVIAGAGIDVFEEEPAFAPGLSELENVTITPHIASATIGTRGKMSEIAASNVIAFLAGEEVPNKVA